MTIEPETPISDRKRLAHLIRSTRQHVVLIDMIRRNGWRRGAEIGVLRGKTLFALLDAVPTLNMIGVDQWKALPLRGAKNAETYSDFDMPFLRSVVLARAAMERNLGRCTILDGDSVEMADKVADGSLDFVFIDGDHTEAGLERDLCAWIPKVRRGPTSMVLGHDWHWDTVRAVLDRRLKGWRNCEEAVWGIPAAEARPW